ncbi:HNH endonuclease [Atlantibacter sp.]|uniref:HNH endonuclease n=1 Tax=Atlantibacter sp. TaxID=1903473 RepID=UPI0028A7FAA3|nr:HNH endonuclease [Atlantibacter sp.]
MQYFYAYHGTKNTQDFNYRNGYGVGQEWKIRQVNSGDRLFIIQKLAGAKDFQLCGLYEVIDTYDAPDNEYPYRVKLEDLSMLDSFLPMDESLIGEQLPLSRRKEPWTNFKRHFCHQGASLGAVLDDKIVSVLNSLIVMPGEQTEAPERREDGLRMVKIRREQKKFRKAVMANWGGKCAITGSSLAVEACHIIRHADRGRASVENGIALAADFHKLFDSDHLSFEGNRIILSESARLEPRYKDIHDTELRVPLKRVNLSVK